MAHYKDGYTANLVKLIKVRGKVKEGVHEPGREEEEPAVIYLMDALRKRLAQARHGAGKKCGKRAHSRRLHAAKTPRRKTG